MYKRFSIILSFVFVILCANAESVTNITLKMDNGDMLSGELIENGESSVVLKVDYLGEITLPKIRILNLDELLAVSVEVPIDEADSQPDAVRIAVAEIAEDEEEVKRDLNRAAEILRAIVPFHNWDKRLQLGLTAQSGRKDNTDFFYRYDMSVKREKQQLRFKANYYYGKAGEVRTSGKFASDFRWRHDFAPGVFYESTTSYLSDDIKLIDSNVEQKLGVGTRFVESDSMTLSSGLGASGRWREFEDMTEEVIYLVDVFQDLDYSINDRLQLKQDLRFAIPIEESDAYEYTFTASLVSEITEAINLSLRYELGFDNSLDFALKEDRRFISSLGYSF